ncbi:MAG: hypothetical protein EXS31_11720 [Pedosphaera sp.]|nr:hypothetical protein [Pedosphaera sp.]
MTRLIRLAAELQSLLDSESWKNCLIGGIVLQRWGEPRLTKDVDMTVLTGFDGEEQVVDLLLSRFAGRRPDTREFALLNQVLLIQSADGIGIDVALGALPFEERKKERASSFDFLCDCRLRTCSAEDFVVMKAFANRERDWLDVETVLIRQGGRLEWKQIMAEL